MNRTMPEDNTLIYGHRYVLAPREIGESVGSGGLRIPVYDENPVYNERYKKYKYIEPVEYADDCYMGDCWIVDEDGNICPGYSNSPVPFHIDNLVKVQGCRAATARQDY